MTPEEIRALRERYAALDALIAQDDWTAAEVLAAFEEAIGAARSLPALLDEIERLQGYCGEGIVHVWLLYAGAQVMGVFRSPEGAITYARKDRRQPHAEATGQISASGMISADVTYARLNERYWIRRETVDPAAEAHACGDGCATAIG